MNTAQPDDEEDVDDGQNSGTTDQAEEASEPAQAAPTVRRSASNDNIVNK
jgi:hypothetical protein